VVEALGSLSLLGRIEQLREIAVAGPLPLDAVETIPGDDPDPTDPDPSDAGSALAAATAPAIDRIRRLLGGTDT